jgi:hypothetical protein
VQAIPLLDVEPGFRQPVAVERSAFDEAGLARKGRAALM